MNSDWVYSKYGKRVQPYTCTVDLDNVLGRNEGQFERDKHYQIHYTYLKKEKFGGEQQEAQPHRLLRINNPCEYAGQLHKQQDPLFK